MIRTMMTRRMLQRTALLGVCSFLLWPVSAEAQRDETLVGRRRGTQFGGFGGPVIKVTRVAGEDAVISGGRGGLIINRQLVIGGGGYALSSENIRTGFEFGNGDEGRLELEYGGLELEYISRPSRVAHVTLYALIGGGTTSYSAERTVGNGTSTQRLSSDVLVFEPAVNLELNVTSWFRTGLGLGYRLVDGSELPRAADSELSGGVGTITFKFGSF
jgi:hypothetical protein